MKFTLLLLPLFIAVCTAVSKSHLKLRTLAAQFGGSDSKIRSNLVYTYSKTNPAEIQVPPGTFRTFRVRFITKTQQKIKIDNGQGITLTWGIDAEGNLIGKEKVQVPADEDYTWTITAEYQQDGSWKPSLMSITLPSRKKRDTYIATLNGDDPNIEDADFDGLIELL